MKKNNSKKARSKGGFLVALRDNFILPMVSLLIYAIIMIILISHQRNLLGILLSVIYFMGLFGYYFYYTVRSVHKGDFPGLIAGYISFMLVIAMVFAFIFLYVQIDHGGYLATTCNSTVPDIRPETLYYFSVSNLFSLSYGEPVCPLGASMKIAVAAEAIFGHVVSLIVMGILLAIFINKIQENNKKSKFHKEETRYLPKQKSPWYLNISSLLNKYMNNKITSKQINSIKEFIRRPRAIWIALDGFILATTLIGVAVILAQTMKGGLLFIFITLFCIWALRLFFIALMDFLEYKPKKKKS